MSARRHRNFLVDMAGVLLLAPLLAAPLLATDPFVLSLTYQTAIGISAAMGIYIMLRLGLLSFTVPAFMAIGGYAAAITAKSCSHNLVILMIVSFVVPSLVAVPIGALVLRLRGVYFIFITYVFNEILQLVIFETPDLTGGANGISGIPPASLFTFDMSSNAILVFVTVLICIAATVITLTVTHRLRPEFASIAENETLAESLGVVAWKYRTIGFVSSAGVSGLAGFALVNMLATAHPSSFSSWSVNDFIAYVFVGGRSTMLGVVIGSAFLIVMSNLLGSQGYLSAGLFGLLLVVVLMAAPGGIVGSFMTLFERLGTPERGRKARERLK
jgi:branched-chain amino acid transport system permease protein